MSRIISEKWKVKSTEEMAAELNDAIYSMREKPTAREKQMNKQPSLTHGGTTGFVNGPKVVNAVAQPKPRTSAEALAEHQLRTKHRN